jgi:hypothetical protein
MQARVGRRRPRLSRSGAELCFHLQRRGLSVAELAGAATALVAFAPAAVRGRSRALSGRATSSVWFRVFCTPPCGGFDCAQAPGGDGAQAPTWLVPPSCFSTQGPTRAAPYPARANSRRGPVRKRQPVAAGEAAPFTPRVPARKGQPTPAPDTGPVRLVARLRRMCYPQPSRPLARRHKPCYR